MLVDEAADLIERTPSLAHVVVDEAQDLSPMECRAIGRRCATGSATVLGDIAQGTTPWAAASWPQLLSHLGKQEAGLRVLDTGYRVPRQILDFASRLLGHIAPGPGRRPGRCARIPASLVVTEAARRPADRGPGRGLRRRAGPPGLGRRDRGRRPGASAVRRAAPGRAAARGARRRPRGREQLILVPVTLAKGLEFDHVIVVEPDRIAAAESRGLQRLYVALTRAVSRLTVLHAEPLPAPLRPAEIAVATSP